MTIQDLIKSGQLAEARSQLIERVKSNPADASSRTLLFQVLVLQGEWDKAERHLDAIAVQDKSGNPAFLEYKNLLEAERERLKVLRNDALPSFLPKTPPYFDLYYQACDKLRKGDLDEAADLFQQVETQIPSVSGEINGNSFSEIKNTDTRLAYFLEVFAYGKYVWVPFESIRELILSPPKTLFDLIWASASLTTWEGLSINSILPVLYPDSSSHENDLVKMGKMTEWQSLGGSFAQGQGQHVFETGKEDVALLEMKEVIFKLSETL